jgi:LAO/AO transport system kinase
MNRYVSSLELLSRARAGETAAIGRLISRAEANVAEARGALSTIYQKAGRAHVIGLTGVPGSGKSTLVAALTARLRADGEKVGIVAVDPSSPYTGGAILGDRIRMSELARDPGVYIRSMSTRGATGGLARATLDAVDILDVSGFKSIIIETVGVGQSEVEIAKAAHTIIVVSAPGLGDEIQAIKAGMLEIADIHVVSKCDRSDANRTLVDIKQMMTLAASASEPPEWQIPVLGVSSHSSEGLDNLANNIKQHRGIAFMTETGRRRQLSIANFRLGKTAENILIERFAKASAAFIPSIAARLQRRESDPYSLATELLAASLT